MQELQAAQCSSKQLRSEHAALSDGHQELAEQNEELLKELQHSTAQRKAAQQEGAVEKLQQEVRVLRQELRQQHDARASLQQVSHSSCINMPLHPMPQAQSTHHCVS